jgi:hypothetical protein
LKIKARFARFYTALWTFPALRHLVQTLIFLTSPSTMTLTFWTFGFHQRLFFLLEWLTVLPVVGLFPQISQTFDIVIASFQNAFFYIIVEM